MIALIDSDIVAYRVGYTTEKDDLSVALRRCDSAMDTILRDIGTTEYRAYLSDSPNNFRLALYPQYKANRTAPKPIHLEDIKEHLITEWGAMISPEQEADDALGIGQNGETIICSNDKDLLQIAGWHYNIVTGLRVFQEPFSGLNWFYQQLLIGDTADNVFGVRGIGKVWAERLLAQADTEWKMFCVVRDLYKDDARLLMNGRVLKIRQKEGELWEFPVEAAVSETEGKTFPAEGEGYVVGDIPRVDQ